jgi:hypothetical protein
MPVTVGQLAGWTTRYGAVLVTSVISLGWQEVCFVPLTEGVRGATP